MSNADLGLALNSLVASWAWAALQEAMLLTLTATAGGDDGAAAMAAEAARRSAETLRQAAEGARVLEMMVAWVDYHLGDIPAALQLRNARSLPRTAGTPNFPAFGGGY
jgi:hypothetical protein